MFEKWDCDELQYDTIMMSQCKAVFYSMLRCITGLGNELVLTK